MKQRSSTSLSTGVELGIWGIPANPKGSLPPLNLSPEELTQLIQESQEDTENLIKKLENHSRKHSNADFT